ncbi:MAG: tRNA (adenosine(37)-N6)-threonylcarbamoyltransferase complex transferase subunit TsaD [Candidatus Zixiibacteriota bacterium]
MLVLGIETSCDETSAAVVRDGQEILSNVILSQTAHRKYGGVVPEVASRTHLKTVIPIVDEALVTAGVTLDRIELVAATRGPGLVGPLLVGLTFAKGLAFASDIPFVAVNHLEGHIASNRLEHPDLDTPHLVLVVSGGHTMLVEVREFGEYVMLGQTRDDAAGEAFDKVAKLLGLAYPGGAELDRLAQKGDPEYVRFPRAVMKVKDYRFSFSGLKTAVAVYLKKLPADQRQRRRADIAASFQEAAVAVLVEKTVRAARQTGVRDVCVAGGVAANSRLRELLSEQLNEIGCRFYYPGQQLCTDNAAMIAAAGFLRYNKEGPSAFDTTAVPYLKLAPDSDQRPA